MILVALLLLPCLGLALSEWKQWLPAVDRLAFIYGESPAICILEIAQTCIGVIDAASFVKPQMSLK